MLLLNVKTMLKVFAWEGTCFGSGANKVLFHANNASKKHRFQ